MPSSSRNNLGKGTSKMPTGPLFIAAGVVAIGGIIYELLIATAASYMLGDTVLRFSLTIGLFLFGMGIGAWLTGRLRQPAEKLFVVNELALSLLGGHSITLLSLAFAYRLNAQFLLVLLSLAVGALVGAEVPLLVETIRSSSDKGTRRILSNVLSLDYAGSLIASIAFPILLLPKLGLIRTAYMAAFLNLVMVSMIVLLRRGTHAIPKKLVVATLAIALSLIGGYLYDSKLQGVLNKSIYSDQVVYHQQTKYQKIVLTQSTDDFRLFLNDHLQFSSIDEARYHESLIHPLLSNIAKRDNVLVLGGGDGLAVREILKYKDVDTIDLVDLDPAMTDLAKNDNRFRELNKDSLLNNKIRITNEDAFIYIQNTTDKYDAIIVDLPDPNSSSLAKLYSDTFYLSLKARLRPEGGIIVQSSSPYFARRTYWTIEKTISSTGLQTYPLHTYVPTFGEWGFIVALYSGRELQIDPMLSTAFITQEQLVAMQEFPADMMAKEDEEYTVSTLLKPGVHIQYSKDYSRWSQ